MNWNKYKYVYFLFSAILIALSAFGLLKWGLNLGVDFSGGTVLEYRIEGETSTENITTALEEEGIVVQKVQKSSENTYFIYTEVLDTEAVNKMDSKINNLSDKNTERLSVETVGPTVGPELIKKTTNAIAIASIAILLWIAYQFKSLVFGTAAVLAMFHDSFILIGSFAYLGYFFGAEIDFLFVTALLTTLSFSVHDTIVVFDRIRELQKKEGGSIEYLANRAVSETMVRSLNNSFTIIFMLVALVLMGGVSIRWFATALLIGTILGTYSSPFVAVPLLVTIKEAINKVKEKDIALRPKLLLPFKK